MELSIVMPCLNEAETLSRCIREALAFLEKNSIDGEVVVSDNGSTDGSHEIALGEGARLVHAQKRGYGSALLEGIQAARGCYIAIGDADLSYDFSTLMPFVVRLRAGDDLVMGNRFAGGIEQGAMPFHHRYFGNPILSGIGRLFFRTPIRDFHCGLRAFKRDAILGLKLRTSGMEFASEMVVKASLAKLRISEVPTPLRRDGRSRPPHLKSFRDGWRHLRFLLLYSPRWLFLYPGLALFVISLVLTLRLLGGPAQAGTVMFDVGSLLFAGAGVIGGSQFVIFAVLSRALAVRMGLLPMNGRHETFFRLARLERGVIAGIVITVSGTIASLAALNYWRSRDFGSLDAETAIRVSTPGFLLMVAGIQVVLGSLLLGLIRIDTES